MTTNGSASRHEEYQYLDLVRRVIDTGEHRADRTGTGTLALFAPPNLRFSLADGTLPLLTTKLTRRRAIIEELLWFISGCTDSEVLRAKGIPIWDGNGSKEFLEKRGLGHRREGDLGPVYGFQWRFFGARYVDCETDYHAVHAQAAKDAEARNSAARGEGSQGEGDGERRKESAEEAHARAMRNNAERVVDQLQECIDKIKHNPTDRRIILSAWNPKDIPDMALPPCHMMCQFYVHTPPPPPAASDPGRPQPKPKLSCLMYQRSADLGLGVPFNIASYAILTHIVAHVTDTVAHELVIQLGDAHVYKDHVAALETQLAPERTPLPFPKLVINPDVRDIDGFRYEDFKVVGYEHRGEIKMKMSV